MDALAIIGERRIAEAVARGELDDLPSKGQPLRIEDISGIPDELRLGYLMLRTTGFVSEELAAKRDLLQLQDLLDACEQPAERAELRRRLSIARLRWEMLSEQRGGSEAPAEYRARLERHLDG